MRTITLIYDGTFNTYRWLKTMMWARKEFLEIGYKIKFANIFDYIPYPKSTYVPYEQIKLKLDVLGTFDIVFVAFHHSQSIIGQDSEKRINLVKLLKQRCNLLCWLDTADSTGTCLFDVLPYVDLYFKKQLLKDTNLYTNEFYCGRIYSDYYHKELGLHDEFHAATHYPIATKENLHKLRISWNVAFYDRFGGKTWIYKHPFRLANPTFIDTDEERTIDIHYGGSNPKVYGEVVGYQRKKMLELIMELQDVTHPNVYKKVSRGEYLEELKHSKAIASPFGWGECCLRDFEAFCNKAILLKPSMEHCITYPNLYIPFETYVPIQWDFSDFNNIVKDIHDGKYNYVAINGLNNYRNCRVGANAKQLFARHIINQLYIS